MTAPLLVAPILGNILVGPPPTTGPETRIEPIAKRGRYLDPPVGRPAIGGYVAFHWKLMDAWFEKDEEVFVHARDPYHRIDVLDSSREVRVVIGGEAVAVTRRARFLFETGLPTRYYIPKEGVRMDLLQPSLMKTACAYKGPTSEYSQARTAGGEVRDVAWCYESPNPEVARIAGMVAFFTEGIAGDPGMAVGDSGLLYGEIGPT